MWAKLESVKVAKDGTKLGDFVLLMGKTPMYGRVIEIKKNVAGEHHYMVRRGTINAGDELDSYLCVERVLNLDLTTPKRTTRATALYSKDYVVVDKEFVANAFRKLNDTIAYIRMISEQEGLA